VNPTTQTPQPPESKHIPGQNGISGGRRPAYVPDTPWRPIEATGATIAALLLSLAIGLPLALAVAVAADADVIATTVLGTLLQQGLMIAIVLWLARRRGGTWSRVLALGPPRGGVWSYAEGAAILIGTVAIMSTAIHTLDPTLIKSDLKQFAAILNSPWWWAMFPMVGIGAPLWEELAFRGFLFSAIAQSRLGTMGAAIITSAIWAAVHPYSVLGVIQVFVIGMIFAAILIRTGSLRVPIVIHAVYNIALTTVLVSDAGKSVIAP